MGPYGDDVAGRLKQSVHDLSNAVTVIHACLYALREIHSEGLTEAVLGMIDDATKACRKAMDAVHEIHGQIR